MRPFLTALAAMSAACLLAACDATERPVEPVLLPAAPSAPDTPEFISPVGAWQVTSLRGEPVPDGVTPPRLTIDPNGTASGYDGINWCNGVLNRSWDRGAFAYRPGFQTMRGNVNQQVNEVASRYKAALQEATTFTFRSGGLELRNDDGDVIVSFEAVDSSRAESPMMRPSPTTLVAGSPAATATPEGMWILASLRGEAPSTGARTPTLTIDAEGRASGHAGVNQYWADVDPGAWSRGAFEFGRVKTTLIGSSREAMDAESGYLGALSEATSFAVRSGGLELTSDARIVIVRFEPATPAGRWRLAALRGESVPAGARTPTLTIESDGLISGFAGVNLYWTAVHPGAWPRGGFELGAIRMTDNGNTHDAMSAESRYLKALGEATTFAVRSGALELSNDADVVILRFEPAAP